MSIYYSLISRGATVLVDYAECSGNFRQIALAVLQKTEVDKNTMCSYSSEQYLFHLIIDDGLIYLCMADKDMGKIVPYNYLNEIKSRFKSGSLKDRALHCGPYELKRDFATVLAQQLKHFNRGEYQLDNIKSLQNNVNQVNSIMTQNIEKVVERGERLDVLVEKTDELTRSSESFGIVSRRLKNKYWWQNKKMCIILSLVAVIVIVIIVVIVLFKTKVL
ncbi:vesicle-associated membrane protein 7 isoform X2 [Hydra vulgaris]|uniref:Vesicle-associated membrane protein 7 n=1 Tax=Hydra vulgaris TaxID=6087 RepID=A0ABM4D432_HYDVU